MTDYQFYKRIGICPICTKVKIFGSECACTECRAKRAEVAFIRRSKDREATNKYVNELKKKISDERRANGECYVCGKKLLDLRYKACSSCRKKKNELQKQRNLRLS